MFLEFPKAWIFVQENTHEKNKSEYHKVPHEMLYLYMFYTHCQIDLLVTNHRASSIKPDR